MFEPSYISRNVRRGLALASIFVLAAPATVEANSKRQHNEYRVFGTCAIGSCGLNERTAPTVHAQKIGQLHDGDTVKIICQEPGQELDISPTTIASFTIGLIGTERKGDVWDKIHDHNAAGEFAFVTNLFVNDTPGGGFSSKISRCE